MLVKQKIEIAVLANDGRDLGTLEIKCDEYVNLNENDIANRNISNMLLTNVPLNFDNKTPIIYYENN